MEEIAWERIRELIVDIYCVGEEGLYFETDIALIKGYSLEEIKLAENIFETNPRNTTKAKQLVDDIMFCAKYRHLYPMVYYIEAVKLLFVCDKYDKCYTYIYEEDLAKEVSNTEFSEEYLWYVINKSYNDAYGEPI